LGQWIAYFVGFPHSPITVRPFDELIFAVVYLGAPVGFPFPSLDLMAGLLSLGLFVYAVALCRRHTTLRRIDVWICLAIFVLVCDQVTALGRTVGYSLSSRYLAFSGLWWVALFVMSAVALEPISSVRKGTPRSAGRPRRGLIFSRTCLAVLILAGLGLVLANASGLAIGVWWQDLQRANQDIVVQYASAPDSCLSLYFYMPATLRQRAAFLAHNHLAIFSGPALTLRSAPHACSAR
jgi:hypothetical protein